MYLLNQRSSNWNRCNGVLVGGFESNSTAQDDKSNKSNLNINRIQIFFKHNVPFLRSFLQFY
jgi:hypothetical protein